MQTEFVANILTAFRISGCIMRTRLHYLFSYMDRFCANLESMSDEQCERFHQDIKDLEPRNQGRLDAILIVD